MDLQGAQLGDASFGQVAGRDIYQGAQADNLVNLLRYQIDKDSQYRMLDLKAREIRQQQVDQQHKAIMDELLLQRWTLIIGLLLIIVGLFLQS